MQVIKTKQKQKKTKKTKKKGNENIEKSTVYIRGSFFSQQVSCPNCFNNERTSTLTKILNVYVQNLSHAVIT